MGAHMVVMWSLAAGTYAQRTEPVMQTLIATILQTNNSALVSANQVFLVTHATTLQDPIDLRMSLPTAPVFEFTEPNGDAVSVAPRLLDATPADMAPFARQGGLLPGESAVVVLRIEVLSDGQVGQVQVDVSSGSRQVDAAAMDYVRTLAWLPGRFHGIEESTWVRHGVRLVA